MTEATIINLTDADVARILDRPGRRHAEFLAVIPLIGAAVTIVERGALPTLYMPPTPAGGIVVVDDSAEPTGPRGFADDILSIIDRVHGVFVFGSTPEVDQLDQIIDMARRSVVAVIKTDPAHAGAWSVTAQKIVPRANHLVITGEQRAPTVIPEGRA